MASLIFDNVSVEFPVYSANSRSIKNKILNVATGGQVGANVQGRVIIKALQDLSFTVGHGERVGLVGHNGAGKSTLLRLLGGIYHPTSGAITIEGKVGSLIDIGMGIHPDSTGRENIYLRGGLLGLRRKEIEHYINDIIDFSELGSFIDLPLHTYSSGMHLRLAFSISTMIKPEILLMDEWLSVGDESFKTKVQLRMDELLSSTNILIIASHLRDLISKVCNRIIWLEHGRIRMDGPTKEVLAAYYNDVPILADEINV